MADPGEGPLFLDQTEARTAETSVIVNNNSLIQDYVYPDDQTQPTFGMFSLLPCTKEIPFSLTLIENEFVAASHCLTSLQDRFVEPA